MWEGLRDGWTQLSPHFPCQHRAFVKTGSRKRRKIIEMCPWRRRIIIKACISTPANCSAINPLLSPSPLISPLPHNDYNKCEGDGFGRGSAYTHTQFGSLRLIAVDINHRLFSNFAVDRPRALLADTHKKLTCCFVSVWEENNWLQWDTEAGQLFYVSFSNIRYCAHSLLFSAFMVPLWPPGGGLQHRQQPCWSSSHILQPDETNLHLSDFALYRIMLCHGLSVGSIFPHFLLIFFQFRERN